MKRRDCGNTNNHNKLNNRLDINKNIDLDNKFTNSNKSNVNISLLNKKINLALINCNWQQAQQVQSN